MREEKFQFTANHIGSEVLERFSRDIYQPKAIIRELVKNGHDSYLELDQYLDDNDIVGPIHDLNERVVNVSVANNSLVVSDNGIGLDRVTIDRLVSIALTEKRGIQGVSGFRGIGFWSAYTGGDQIVIDTTKLGDSKRYRMTLNTKRMRELQGPTISIGAIMNDPKCVVLQSELADKDKHFTQIIIHAETKSGSLHDLVQDRSLLRKNILEGCPCRLSEGSHNFNEVNDFYNRFHIPTSRVEFQGIEVTKSIPTTVGPLQRKPLQTRIGNQDILLAETWYCTNQSNAVITHPLAGLRIFRDGIPIGRSNLYSEKEYISSQVKVTRPDLLFWHIGEIHVLLPTLSRCT